MAEFAYHNVKNANTEYMHFKINCSYHLYIFYKTNVNSYSKSQVADKLTKKLRNLMAAYKENLEHIQELQKRVYNKETKPKS